MKDDENMVVWNDLIIIKLIPVVENIIFIYREDVGNNEGHLIHDPFTIYLLQC